MDCDGRRQIPLTVPDLLVYNTLEINVFPYNIVDIVKITAATKSMQLPKSLLAI